MRMDEAQESFWRLLEPIYSELGSFCIRLTGDCDNGNDLLHEALIGALNRFEQLREESSFRPWLYRIVITTFRGRFRSSWWKKRVPLTEEIVNSLVNEDMERQQNARRWLERAFEAISPESKALVILHEMEGWTVAELSGIFNKSESAIKVELHRSRKKMKDAILKMVRKLDQSLKTVIQTENGTT